jgi:cytochrome c oxidase cbb3-type subunit 2
MKHEVFEKNSLILLIGILLVVSIGGIVQIAPLFWVESTIEKVKGMRPYTPLEQAGRDIYVREGCYGCHSQMIRTLRDEVERYGHYSLAAESMYDHPFQWGPSAPGPISPASAASTPTRQAEHLVNPRAGTREHHAGLSMARRAQARRRGRRRPPQDAELVGVPYSDEMIDKAKQDLAGPGHARQPSRARAAPLSKGQGRQVRRQARQRAHRARRAHRLSAGARNARRLRHLRRLRPEPAVRSCQLHDL